MPAPSTSTMAGLKPLQPLAPKRATCSSDSLQRPAAHHRAQPCVVHAPELAVAEARHGAALLQEPERLRGAQHLEATRPATLHLGGLRNARAPVGAAGATSERELSCKRLKASWPLGPSRDSRHVAPRSDSVRESVESRLQLISRWIPDENPLDISFTLDSQPHFSLISST